MDAKSSTEVTTELAIVQKIKECRTGDPTSSHIVTNLDVFEHSGPNSVHVCLVTEPMGPTISSLAEELIPWEEWTTEIRYPVSVAKRILKDTLLGLKFLHSNGIVHGDLQSGNLISTISSIDDLCEEELQQDVIEEGRISAPEPVRRRDGLQDPWAPRFLYLGQSLVKYTPQGQDLKVNLSDLGASFLVGKPPSKSVVPVALRAPELKLGGEIGPSIDIWSLGCLIFELLNGSPLLTVMVLFEDHREFADDEHLMQMNDILETLPDCWLQEKWPRARKYFGPGRERLEPHSDQHNEPSIYEPLEAKFMQDKPAEIEDAEAAVITSLIRRILKYDPLQRPTAEELLSHPWFKG